MRKCDEARVANSCWNKASEDEFIFAILGRDAAGPATIRAWIKERIRLGLNDLGDEQLRKAEDAIKHYAQPSSEPCDRPPPGWKCSRGKGHGGPCAALPVFDKPKAKPTTDDELKPLDVVDGRIPCPRCGEKMDIRQVGLIDIKELRIWECPGCRRVWHEWTPTEIPQTNP
jgi:hypothetical protein